MWAEVHYFPSSFSKWENFSVPKSTLFWHQLNPWQLLIAYRNVTRRNLCHQQWKKWIFWRGGSAKETQDSKISICHWTRWRFVWTRMGWSVSVSELKQSSWQIQSIIGSKHLTSRRLPLPRLVWRPKDEAQVSKQSDLCKCPIYSIRPALMPKHRVRKGKGKQQINASPSLSENEASDNKPSKGKKR